MLAILKKELNLFFASPIGYLVIAIFLIINGLFLWVFKGDYNILNAGFSEEQAAEKIIDAEIVDGRLIVEGETKFISVQYNKTVD